MTPDAGRAHFIFYVADQAHSTRFYAQVLDAPPVLDVPGMTEFALPGGAVLGLMPAAGIVALLGAPLRDPRDADGIARAELYLVAADPDALLARALAAGARALSPMQPRGWGHRAGYCADPDGHVLAFAASIAQ